MRRCYCSSSIGTSSTSTSSSNSTRPAHPPRPLPPQPLPPSPFTYPSSSSSPSPSPPVHPPCLGRSPRSSLYLRRSRRRVSAQRRFRRGVSISAAQDGRRPPEEGVALPPPAGVLRHLLRLQHHSVPAAPIGAQLRSAFFKTYIPQMKCGSGERASHMQKVKGMF